MSDEVSGLSGPVVFDRKGALARAVNALLDIGAQAGDRPDERLQKRLQIAMASSSVVFVGAWGLSFLLVDRPDAAVQPLYYCAGTVAMLAHLWRTRRYAFFRSAHTLLVMLGPFFLQLYLGGFAASGGAMLWSFIAPVAAMMFVGRKVSLAWVVLLGVLLCADLVRELAFPAQRPLSLRAASIYFSFNTAGMLVFLYFSTRYFTGRIQAEQERADRLLLNILPRPIAERLKRRPGVVAERFEAVTVVFADLVGFTGLSQRLQPEQLVKLLDEIFSTFDRLAERHGLEKIKTIGDAYMVVAGVPERCVDHAQRAARMALGMREAISTLAAERQLGLSMRIGLHTGEVVAGVIGRKKFSYDLWGDTVNTASRMESHGEAGRIQLSAATRAALGDAFRVTARGRVPIKGKGEMETAWLEG